MYHSVPGSNECEVKINDCATGMKLPSPQGRSWRSRETVKYQVQGRLHIIDGSAKNKAVGQCGRIRQFQLTQIRTPTVGILGNIKQFVNGRCCKASSSRRPVR